MGAILDYRQPESGTDSHDLVHVRQVATHVGQQNELCRAGPGLALQIIDIDDGPVGDVDKNWLRAGMGYSTGYRSQRKGVDQHLVARGDTCRPQCDKKSAAARIGADTVFAAEIGSEFFFKQGCLGKRIAVLAVAEQPAIAHQFHGGLDSSLRDRFGCTQITGKTGTVCLCRTVANGHYIVHDATGIESIVPYVPCEPFAMYRHLFPRRPKSPRASFVSVYKSKRHSGMQVNTTVSRINFRQRFALKKRCKINGFMAI